MSMQPYRSEATAIVVAKPKQMYGLIIAEKPHRCMKPGFIARWWKGIIEGSLFRCHCSKVWRWGWNGQNYVGNVPESTSWKLVSANEWLSAGGDLEIYHQPNVETIPVQSDCENDEDQWRPSRPNCDTNCECDRCFGDGGD